MSSKQELIISVKIPTVPVICSVLIKMQQHSIPVAKPGHVFKPFAMCSSRKKTHTHPKEGHWKFLGEEVSKKPKILEAKYGAKLEFPGRGGMQNKKNLLCGEYGYFSGTA